MMLKQISTKSLKMTETTEKPCSFGRVMNAVFRKNRKSKKSESPLNFVTIGGVYFEAGESSSESKPKSSKSLDSVDTESSSGIWNSSGASDHHKGAPRIAKNFSQRRINPNNIHLSEEEMVGRMMLKSRKLPKNNGYIISNHVMINNERTRLSIAPLKRMPVLDEIARAQAKIMAEEDQLFHSNPEELREEIAGQEVGRRIGENVAKGADLRAIHKNMMTNSLADKNNLLDRRYTSMGVGTGKGSDGTLYLCQIFRD
jgi:uncharacterized protein YkwD